ncbi:MAG: DNA-binding protein, partial [Oscillospiraceae bacterium]|nr:DNA-binding protein [Oscillospiraceae bacterium]
MDKLCLGFDTSNYTTSAALFGGATAEDRGRLLTVPEGALGLRQSDALFQHVKRLHLMVEQLRSDGVMGDIAA